MQHVENDLDNTINFCTVRCGIFRRRCSMWKMIWTTPLIFYCQVRDLQKKMHHVENALDITIDFCTVRGGTFRRRCTTWKMIWTSPLIFVLSGAESSEEDAARGK
jgi:hypothetical protein